MTHYSLGFITKPDVTPPAPSFIFEWEPELAQAIPVTSTFTRSSIAQALTTTDGVTSWYQETPFGEIPLDGLRRIEQLFTNADFAGGDPPTSWAKSIGGSSSITTTTSTGPGANGVTFASGTSGFCYLAGATLGAVKNGEIIIVAAFVESVNCDQASTLFRLIGGGGSAFSTILNATGDNAVAGQWIMSVFEVTTSGTAVTPRIGLNDGLQDDDITLSSPIAFRVQDASSVFGDWVNDVVTYNANVDGVRYFNTANGNSVDGNGVVTLAAGATITGGGYAPGPFSINRFLASNDMTDAAWTAIGAATPTDLGVTDIGGQTTQISGIGAEGVDDISQAGAGFTASGAVAASLSLRRVSTTGVLRIINSTGAANGEWQVDLSLIGADWVQLKAVDSTSPIVTVGTIQAREADDLTDVAWPAQGAAVIDTTVAGVTVSGFSEVTPWVADGGGNAGVLFHAASGGPLTVDIAFNQLEDSAGAEMRMLGFGDNSAFSFRLDVPTVARIATGALDSSITAANSYESERHGFGMSFQVNEGIVVDDEDNDNTDAAGSPGGGTIQVGLNSGLLGLPGRYHNIQIANVPQTVAQLKALV